jgi:hypothetical protein
MTYRGSSNRWIKARRLDISRVTTRKTGNGGKWLTNFQVIVGIIVSVAAAFVSWQAHRLNEYTAETTVRLKAIEQQLAESRFGFERMRDIYDRTENFLAAPAAVQNSSRGRVLAVLINSIPDASVRSELLSVITNESKSSTVAAAAATLNVTGRLRPAKTTTVLPSEVQSASSNPTVPTAKFSGNLALFVNEETYKATTLGEFTFTDSKGVTWRVPKGFVSDASSVPRSYWSLAGPPLTSDYTLPTVLLDYYVTLRKNPPEQVYQMFFDSLIAIGMAESKAKIFHSAILRFGPRWTVVP